MPDISDLRQRQHLPLRAKVLMSQNRIREWYDHFGGAVCVSFSGGKDSTVLAHLVRDIYPDVPLVFANTGLEYPEIQAFARRMGAEFVRPKMSFSEVLSRYGYPIISKENAEAIYYARKTAGYKRKRFEQTERIVLLETEHKRKELQKNYKSTYAKRDEISGTVKGERSVFEKTKWLPLCRDTQFLISGHCCSVMKKGPILSYQKKNKLYPIIGTLAEESTLRKQAWLRHGCNAFESNKPTSQPLSFWTEQDILRYIKDNGLEIASVYGEIVGVDGDGMQYDMLPGVDYCLRCTKAQRTGCVFCGFGVHLEKGETRFQRLAKTHPKQYEYCIGGVNG